MAGGDDAPIPLVPYMLHEQPFAQPQSRDYSCLMRLRNTTGHEISLSLILAAQWNNYETAFRLLFPADGSVRRIPFGILEDLPMIPIKGVEVPQWTILAFLIKDLLDIEEYEPIVRSSLLTIFSDMPDLHREAVEIFLHLEIFRLLDYADVYNVVFSGYRIRSSLIYCLIHGVHKVVATRPPEILVRPKQLRRLFPRATFEGFPVNIPKPITPSDNFEDALLKWQTWRKYGSVLTRLSVKDGKIVEFEVNHLF